MKRTAILLTILAALWAVVPAGASPKVTDEEAKAIEATLEIKELTASPAPISKPPVPAIVPLQECRGTTLRGRRVEDGLRVFTALFRPSHSDAMMAQGCVRYFKGCNSCVVRYRNCSAKAAKCTDGTCLEKHCERKVRCTSKFCTATAAQPPSCGARIARHNCALTLFEGKEGSLLEGVSVVRRK